MNIQASVRYTIKNLRLSQDEEHPNKLPFTGTLLILDKASDKPPHGSDGHKIFVSKAVAERRLSTLVGMPLNYDDELSDHNTQNAVGVITAAWIEDNRVEVQGYVWKKTFPGAEDDLHGKDLGMSMELADVEIQDKDADIWRLEDFYFTGATALWPDSAAYRKTALAAAAAATKAEKENNMPEDKKKKAADKDQGRLLVNTIAASTAKAVGEVIAEANKPVIALLTTMTEKLSNLSVQAAGETEEDRTIRELSEAAETALTTLEASEEEDDIDAADDTEEEKKKKKDDAAEESDEEETEDEEMEATSEGVDIADQNKDAKNKGNKTTVSSGALPSKAKEAMKAAASTIKTMGSRLKTLEASLQKSEKLRKKEKARLDQIEGQLEASAQHVARKTVTPELANLLEKNGVDLQAAGSKKLTVAFVDKMFDTAGFQLEPHMRMAFKNQLRSAGVLETERTM